jgi:cell division protein FtsW
MNLCVVVGLIPVTGVTLPFISYGGSSLIVSMISMGIILNISRNIS